MKTAKKDSTQQKRKRVKAEKKKETLKARAFIVISILFLIYSFFFREEYIGGDYRYFLYILIFPIIIGAVIVARYLINDVWLDAPNVIQQEKFIFSKIIYLPILFFSNLILAYLFFCFPVDFVWNYLNVSESKKNPIEIVELPVVEFRKSGRRSSNKVSFIFNNKNEYVPVSSEFIKPYLSKNAEDYKAILKIKRGIWNEYLVQDIDIVKREISRNKLY
ncbi:hypothetical protein ACFO7M_16155 [Flavobacterium sp. GCM10023249]